MATRDLTDDALRAHYARRTGRSVSLSQWLDWRWQIENALADFEKIATFLGVDSTDHAAKRVSKRFPPFVTPYFLALAALESACITRQCLPDRRELLPFDGAAADPLAEEHDSVTPHLIRRYPDRVVFLVTNRCAIHCRHCFRKRCWNTDASEISHREIEDALTWIGKHKETRDVLITGGDPLLMDRNKLDGILDRLRRIEHLALVRIGTRVPSALPYAVDRELCAVLQRHEPVYVNIHFNCEAEITPATAKACRRLRSAGAILGSQTVLLRGVNDSAEALSRLWYRLLMIGVRPYYLFLCDPVEGVAHFRVGINEALSMMDKLTGPLSGMATPHLAVDIPGGHGKVRLTPERMRRNGDVIYLRDFRSNEHVYLSPLPESLSD